MLSIFYRGGGGGGGESTSANYIFCALISFLT